ncbi:MAG: CDP-alcohol phosphatidyltransferase family protein [Planctomycetota bacterium]
MSFSPSPSPPPHADRSPAGGWRRHIPNALVFARLALAAAVFAILASWQPQTPGAADSPLLIATALFIVASITDALDGILARRWNAITKFGRVMDPFADKILVLGSFVLLAGPAFAHDAHALTGFTGWMVVAILARELLITSLRGLIEAEGRDFSAATAGKLKMIVQSIATPAVLLILAIDPWDDLFDETASTARAVNTAIAWTTTGITLLSGVPYILAAARPAQPTGDA